MKVKKNMKIVGQLNVVESALQLSRLLQPRKKKEPKMPAGKGTYGKRRGRPSKGKKRRGKYGKKKSC